MKKIVFLLLFVIFVVSISTGAFAYSAPDKKYFDAETEASKIEYTANNNSVIRCTAVDNCIDINGADIVAEFSKTEKTADECVEILSDSGLSLNRELELYVTVIVDGLDLDDFATVCISGTDLKNILNVDNVKIVLGENNEYICLSSEALRSAYEDIGIFKVEIKKISDTYTLRFIGFDGNILERIYEDIKIAFPAVNYNQTVYLYMDNKQENWGGQFNAEEHSIEIMSRYSGEYNVASPNIVIEDIGNLTEYEQAAVMFMTVRGYFDLDGNDFRPDDTLTRYEFAQSLVRMYFALDEKAECTFPDVRKNNEFYKYIAASQERAIVDGFEDGTFRGNEKVTVEQVLAQASRTIVGENGYIYPEQLDQYLRIPNTDEISQWARKEVALAIREGIYDGDMNLEFSQSISRKDAAVILYRLFMIMNNTPKISIVADSDEENELEHGVIWNFTFTMVTVGVTCVAVIAVLIICFVKIKRCRCTDKDKSKKK